MKQILVLSSLLLIGGTMKAQFNGIDISSIEKYKLYLEQKDQYRKQKVAAYAETNNIQQSYYDAQGNFYFLHHIDDLNRPIYYGTKSNLKLAKSIKTDKCWSGGGLGLNLQGQNMEVSATRARLGVWEPGATRTDHKEFGGRAVTRDLPVFTTHSGNTEHATHVTGTMIATGLDAESRGMANQAKIDCYEIQTSEEPEMLTAASEGMLVSNHSYGPSYDNTKTLQGMYNNECVTYDSIVFLAKNYLPCFAIGNERDDANNITWDVASGGGIAKNVLGIGAVDLLPNGYTGPSSVIATDFTNYGPADDGRIKPDFVAPGKDIWSCSSVGDTTHASSSGTSMSTPGVAGSLFLLQEYYKEQKGKFMRAATLKGLAIHSCDEAGAADGPDSKFGWGLMNMQRCYDVLWNTGSSHFMEETMLSNGGTYSNKITTMGGKMQVTICWTDIPGPATASNVKDDRNAKLVNDLDVRIIDSITNNTIADLPWKLDPTAPANNATKGDNKVDNVEQISVSNLPAGTYYVKVTHKGTLSASQEFSVFISGINKSSNASVLNADFMKQVVIAPNPTTGPLQIQLGEQIAAIQYNISNTIGQTVESGVVKNQNQIDLNIDYPKGVYVVEVSTGDGRKCVQRFIKE